MTNGVDPSMTIGGAFPARLGVTQPNEDTKLMQAARELESTFLSEMLKHAGLGETSGSFGGGTGEKQFASLLRDAQASAIAQAGGIGLAQSLFESLKDANDAN